MPVYTPADFRLDLKNCGPAKIREVAGAYRFIICSHNCPIIWTRSNGQGTWMLYRREQEAAAGLRRAQHEGGYYDAEVYDKEVGRFVPVRP